MLAFPSLVCHIMVAGWLLQLHFLLTFIVSLQLKRREQGQRPFSILVCHFFYFPGKGNNTADFLLKSLCPELVHMYILRPDTGSRDYYDWFRPILIHSSGLEER